MPSDSKFVGLPDKFDTRPSNRLRMLFQIQAIPLDTNILGVYWTPDLARLMPLFN